MTVIQHNTLILSTQTYFTRDNQSEGIKVIYCLAFTEIKCLTESGPLQLDSLPIKTHKINYEL